MCTSKWWGFCLLTLAEAIQQDILSTFWFGSAASSLFCAVLLMAASILSQSNTENAVRSRQNHACTSLHANCLHCAHQGSLCSQRMLSHEDQELNGQKELKHLPNVAMRFYCPQAFVGSDSIVERRFLNYNRRFRIEKSQGC